MYVKRLFTGKLFILLTIIFCFIVLTACSINNENNADGYLKLVKTAKAIEVSTIVQKQFPAILEETEEVNLAFRVAGPIHKIYVNEGQFVKKGELIAEIDKRDYEVQKRAIEAQVTQIQSEYSRVEELKKRKSVSDNDYEKMKAGKEMAEAKLKNAMDQLNDTKLYAPFSGYITKRLFDAGEVVNHGTPIVSLIDVSLLKAEIFVPASMYIKIDAITNIECTQDNLPNATFPMTLYANNIKANNNGLYKLYLYHKPQTKSKLAPGMNVSVNINYVAHNNPILSLPINAVFEKDENSFVWLVNNNMVSSRQIKTNSLISKGNIGIIEGLNKGDEVVIGGLNLLSEGDTIRIVKAQSKTNIGNLL